MLFRSSDFTLAPNDDANSGMRLKQSGKNWPSGGTTGLAGEGKWDCKALPWTISNDKSRVYDYWGGEWAGPGDSDFYWGHTQDISGAAQEPHGWAQWSCSGVSTGAGTTAACPEGALNGMVTVNWDAENDNWTKLEKEPECQSSSNSAIGC